MKQVQITLPDRVFDAMKAESERLGIKPSLMARIKLAELLTGFQLDVSEKAYTFKTRAWRELEAYVQVRNLGSIDYFVRSAVDLVMAKNKLSPKQKTEFEKLLGK